MNYRGIIFFLGVFVLIIALFSILNIFYSLYFDFIIGLNLYLITFSISASIGFIFCFVGHNYRKEFSLIDQLVFISLSFLLIPVLISLPYVFSIYDISLLDSYFESVSGFTTTGFSIIRNIKDIDDPLVLWRSSSQLIGGLLFLIAIIGTIGSKQIKIKPSYLIAGGASGRNFYNNFNYNFIKISLIYISSIFLVIVFYSIVNLRLLDSFNIAFSVVSSGGFLPDESLSNILKTDLQIFVVSLTLFLPIFNFFFLQDIFTNKFSFNKYKEDLHLVSLIFLTTIFLYFFVIPNEGFVNVFFSIVSSLSTSGISIYSSNFDLSLFFLLLAIVGGSLISTSSGFKYTRIYILLKISYQEIYRLVKPINIIDKNLYNSEAQIDDQDIKIAFLAFVFFIISIFTLSSILAFDFLNFENSFKLSILTLTNTTNSSLFAINDLNFIDLNNFTKMSLIVFMVFGKIEIISVIYLIRKIIFKQ